MKLEIRKIEGTSGILMHDYKYFLNGMEITHLLSINISMDRESMNIARLSIAVDNLQVDAEFVLMIQAKLDEQKNDNQTR